VLHDELHDRQYAGAGSGRGAGTAVGGAASRVVKIVVCTAGFVGGVMLMTGSVAVCGSRGLP